MRTLTPPSGSGHYVYALPHIPLPSQALAAACVFLACRHEKQARTFKEITAVMGSDVSKKEIGRCFKVGVGEGAGQGLGGPPGGHGVTYVHGHRRPSIR